MKPEYDEEEWTDSREDSEDTKTLEDAPSHAETESEEDFGVSENHAHHSAHKKHTVVMHVEMSKKKIAAAIILVIIAIACVIGWQFDAFAQGSNWYNRATVTVTVKEKDTNKIIAGAQVTIQDKTAVTNDAGKAELTKLTAGATSVTVFKEGYVTYSVSKEIYRGDNPLSDIILEKAPDKTAALTGTIIDAISGVPVSKAKIVFGDKQVLTDDKGAFSLTLKFVSAAGFVMKDGYKQADIKAVPNKTQAFDVATVQVMPLKTIIFEQEKSSKVDLYSFDFGTAAPVALTDGKQQYSSMSPVVAPDGKHVVFASDQDNTKVAGNVVQKLYIRDDKGVVTKLNDDANPQNVMWLSNGLVLYSSITNSADNLSQTALVTYNIDSKKRVVLNKMPTDSKIATTLTSIALSSDKVQIAYGMNAFYSGLDTTVSVDSLKGMFVSKIDGTSLVQLSMQQDTTNLYFTNSNKTIRFSFTGAEGYKIHTIELASKEDKDVTSAPLVRERQYVRDHLSTDGSLTNYDAMTVQTKSGVYYYIDTQNSKTDVFTADSSGKNATQISKIGTVQSLALSADEQYLLLGVRENNSNVLYATGGKGGTATKLTEARNLFGSFLK